MLLSLFQGSGNTWEIGAKVTFNGAAKLIVVNPGVSALDIRADVYSRWVDWRALYGNSAWELAMRYTGLDTIPGGQTGDVYFLYNGWKLIIDFNQVKVSGVLYSDNFTTPYYSASLQPLYAATVAALVNTVTNTQNIVTGDLNSVPSSVWAHGARTLSVNPPTAQQNADAVHTELTELANLDAAISSRLAAEGYSTPPTTAQIWAQAIEGLTAEEILRVMLAALAGKRQGIGTATEEYMGQDGVTPRITLTPDINGNGTPILNGNI